MASVSLYSSFCKSLWAAGTDHTKDRKKGGLLCGSPSCSQNGRGSPPARVQGPGLSSFFHTSCSLPPSAPVSTCTLLCLLRAGFLRLLLHSAHNSRFGLQGAISPSVLDDDVSAADPITNPQIVCLSSSFLPAQLWPSSSFQSKYKGGRVETHWGSLTKADCL